jgi:type I restriction enzyme S subunit
MTDDFPEGWALVRLANVCQINPPKPPVDVLAPETLVTFVPMPAVDADQGAIAKPTSRQFSQVRKGFTAFRNEDVIMAKITPCMENGKAAIARSLLNGLGYGSTEFHVLRPIGSVLPEYVYHFVRQESFRRAAEGEMTGSVGQKRVPASFLEATEIPIPPLAEQQRIVAKVEALLARVKAARQRLAKVLATLKWFRQSVLAAACSGALTNVWREQNANSQTAEQLLAAIQQDQANQNHGKVQYETDDLPDWNLPATWRLVALEGLLRNVKELSYGILKPGTFVEDGVPMVRVMDIGDGAILETQILKVAGKVADAFERTRLSSGDLLLAIMATIGRCAVVPPSLEGANVNRAIAVLKMSKRLVPSFLCAVIRSPLFQERFAAEKIGSAQARINISDLRRFPFPLPPLPEQEEIVRRVDALFRMANKVEMCVSAATARSKKLAQAILAKAFRGELVPTEAELARREGRSYEPASLLLERLGTKATGSEIKRESESLNFKKHT